jgi:hypothetical protein
MGCLGRATWTAQWVCAQTSQEGIKVKLNTRQYHFQKTGEELDMG